METNAVKWRQSSQSNHHSTIGTRQTEYHEALWPSANVQSHLSSLFANNGNTSWYSVCRASVVEWRLDCEDCHHLMVVSLHDTSPVWFRETSTHYSDCELNTYFACLCFWHCLSGLLVRCSPPELFVGCITSPQHANVSQGWTCSDNCTCCHTEIEVADQTFNFTSPSHSILTPGQPVPALTL